jgi:hypothetical protein
MKLFGNIAAAAANIALPGSGIFVKLWGWIRPFLPYVISAIAIAAVLLLIWRAPWAENRQKAKDYAHFQPILTTASTRMAIAAKSLASADRAMTVQSASIRQQAGLMNAAIDKAHKQEVEVRKLDASRQAVIDKLNAAGRRKPAGPPCPSVPEVEEDWK